MLNGLIGRGTAASMLRDGLDASQSHVRGIASRVANALNPQGGDFASALSDANARAAGADPSGEIDLEAEMVALADEQIRFEATTRLLQKVYAQVRTSVRER